jgi:hypothetical protein
MHFETRLWQFTKGVRLRMVYTVLIGLVATCFAQFVTVERRIAPPPAAPERSVPVSEHSAPQCSDAGHAYRAGESPHAPASSHRGSVRAALADSPRVHCGDRRCYDQFQSDPHRPTVCLDVISLVASSCGYNRGEIEPRDAHEFTAHVAAQRGLAERPQHRHPPRA